MKSIWIGLWNHKTSSNILNPALDYSRYRSGTALWKYTNVINWSILIEVFLWYNPHKGLIEINLWVFFFKHAKLFHVCLSLVFDQYTSTGPWKVGVSLQTRISDWVWRFDLYVKALEMDTMASQIYCRVIKQLFRTYRNIKIISWKIILWNMINICHSCLMQLPRTVCFAVIDTYWISWNNF